MGRLIAVILAAALAGCGTQTYKAAGQNYRPKGSDANVEINGALMVNRGAVSSDRAVGIYFNGVKQIEAPLDRNGNGEASGKPFDGKPTSTTCTGRPVSRTITEVRCMVFIDNEKTVTLTF